MPTFVIKGNPNGAQIDPNRITVKVGGQVVQAAVDQPGEKPEAPKVEETPAETPAKPRRKKKAE